MNFLFHRSIGTDRNYIIFDLVIFISLSICLAVLLNFILKGFAYYVFCHPCFLKQFPDLDTKPKTLKFLKFSL